MPENYYQHTGRPHKGLQNPAKYGLTYTEVVELIDRGQWQAFVKTWHRKRKQLETIQEHEYICPECFNLVLEIKDWNAKGERCKECSHKLMRIKRRGNINANVPNQKIVGKCQYCRRLVRKKRKLFDRLICLTCCKLYTMHMREIENESERKRGTQ